ncbi:MAG: hypothetical protein GFH27_549305n230 [Chloroflexi bacterium AL-W]|nr:hypothetical protein [Chloroflexi bacterium AL-N1]NOK71247.1 hypothetical protein [Chloroflexi bacterium AL-N10]NOK76536.1 hypothetical protein [Chloroflexi bacterium AL-N5]NOK83654.1 hypothetical protein [Chloroflexi bacterium AL-W]NOK92225.1 hypothetical protein [Chloroflexi bacterium AL-N15]
MTPHAPNPLGTECMHKRSTYAAVTLGAWCSQLLQTEFLSRIQDAIPGSVAVVIEKEHILYVHRLSPVWVEGIRVHCNVP